MDDCLMGLSLAELAQVLADAGEPAFRAKQVYGWLQKGEDFAGMRNLPAALRETGGGGLAATPTGRRIAEGM